MPLTAKQKYLCIGLLLSTLLFPVQFVFLFLIIPPIYVGFIVPFLIWKIAFNGQVKNITKISLLWKIPLILSFNILNMTFGEFLALNVFYILPYNPFILLVIFGIVIICLRIISYALIILIWDFNAFQICSKIKKLLLTFVLLLCLCGSSFLYSIWVSPDDVSYDSYFMYCLQNGTCEKIPEIIDNRT